MKYIKRFIFWGGLVALIVGGTFVVPQLPTYLEEYTFQPGLRLVDGTPIQGIGQIIPGSAEIIIIVQFSTKCDACHEHLVLMNNLHKPPVFVVAIAIGDSKRAAQRLVDELGLEFPVLIGIRPSEAVDINGQPLEGVPYTCMITKTDYIEWYGAGLPKEAEELLE